MKKVGTDKNRRLNLATAISAALLIHATLSLTSIYGLYRLNPLNLTYLSGATAPERDSAGPYENQPYDFVSSPRFKSSLEIQLTGFSRLGAESTLKRQVAAFLLSTLPFLISAILLRPLAGRSTPWIHLIACVSFFLIIMLGTGLVQWAEANFWRVLVSGILSTVVRSGATSLWAILGTGGGTRH